MQTVRTTVTLPLATYELIRQLAFEKRQTFGQIIVDLFSKTTLSNASAPISSSNKKEMTQEWAFLRKVAKSGKKIDLLKALREDRNRDE